MAIVLPIECGNCGSQEFAKPGSFEGEFACKSGPADLLRLPLGL